MKTGRFTILLAALFAIAGCASPAAEHFNRQTFTTAECVNAARAAADSALKSAVFGRYLAAYHEINGPDAKPLVQLGEVALDVPDTNLAPALITGAFGEELMSAEVIEITMASGRDTAKSNAEARDLEYDGSFNRDTVKKRGTLDGPDLSIEGRIVQSNTRNDSGALLVERSFELSMVNLADGRVIFKKTVRIGYIAERRTFGW